jgi:hypothetical protein
LGDLTATLEHAKHALQLATQVENHSISSAALRYLATVSWQRGEFRVADREYLLSIEAANLAENNKEIGRSHYDYAQFLEENNRRIDCEELLGRSSM